MSTLSKDDNLVLSSEDSSTPDESELELGLGLSLGGACGVVSEGLVKTQKGSRGQNDRILSAFSSASYSSSSSASSSLASSSSPPSLNKANVSAGTKRSADSVAAAYGARYGCFKLSVSISINPALKIENTWAYLFGLCIMVLLIGTAFIWSSWTDVLFLLFTYLIYLF